MAIPAPCQCLGNPFEPACAPLDCFRPLPLPSLWPRGPPYACKPKSRNVHLATHKPHLGCLFDNKLRHQLANEHAASSFAAHIHPPIPQVVLNDMRSPGATPAAPRYLPTDPKCIPMSRKAAAALKIATLGCSPLPPSGGNVPWGASTPLAGAAVSRCAWSCMSTACSSSAWSCESSPCSRIRAAKGRSSKQPCKHKWACLAVTSGSSSNLAGPSCVPKCTLPAEPPGRTGPHNQGAHPQPDTLPPATSGGLLSKGSGPGHITYPAGTRAALLKQAPCPGWCTQGVPTFRGPSPHHAPRSPAKADLSPTGPSPTVAKTVGTSYLQRSLPSQRL